MEITRDYAIYLLGISEEAFNSRTQRHNIKKVRKGVYLRSDIDFLMTIKNRAQNNQIDIFKPVYITTTYHIYESKMNYEQTTKT